MMRSKNILVLLILMVLQNLHGQSSDTGPYEAIKALDTSVLIVRLDMQKRVLDTYYEVLNNPQSSEKQKAMIEKRIKTLEEERRNYKETIIKTMNDYYFFSEYCFIDNHDVPEFLEGDTTVLNCANDFILDMVKKGKYFFLVKGEKDTELNICDSDFKILAHPFPANHDIGFAGLLNILFAESPYEKNMMKVVGKMQLRLDKFLLKAQQ